jgi:hypothetical protein
MKWISQFRTSASLDDRKASAGHSAAGESSGFAQQMAHLDHQLKATRPDVAAPPFLHNSIMAAVRAAADPSPETSKSRRAWWLATAAGSALVVVLAIYFVIPHPVVPSPVRNLNQQMVALPSTVLSPLSDELQRVHKDLQNTTQFLLASVPEVEN